MFKTHYLIIYTVAMMILISACNPFDSSNSTRIINSENASSEESATIEYYGAKFVAEVAELPICDTIQQGQIFYIIATATFNLCTDRGYITLDLTGAQGVKGDSGSTGLQGPQGESGASGANGAVGVDGVDGATCSGQSITEGVEIYCNDILIDTIRHGQEGTTGDQGLQGDQGLRGDEGVPGDSGVAGASFFTGDSIPGIDVGNEGDTYLDFLTNILFQKDSNGWNVINSYAGILQGDGQYLLRAGVTIQDMLATGASYMDLHKAGIVYADFNGAGINDSLLDANYLINYITDARDTTDIIAYKQIAIGNKYWFTTNAKYLPNVHTATIGSEISGREDEQMFYVMNYTPTGVDSSARIANAKLTTEYQEFGVLYNRNAADSACPGGSSLPTREDWNDLIEIITNYLSNVDIQNSDPDVEWSLIGTTLKSQLGWSPNLGTNDFKFGAIPTGYRTQSSKTFNGEKNESYFWSSFDNMAVTSFYKLNNSSNTLFKSDSLKANAYSVRCVNDRLVY